MTEPCWNVAPTMRRPVMRVEGAALVLDDLHWGYQAIWAKGKMPVAVNARLEKITGKYWASLLGRGRCIVPADGWHEWTEEKGSKQPWHTARTASHFTWPPSPASARQLSRRPATALRW
eukprot:gene37116-biopygen30861